MDDDSRLATRTGLNNFNRALESIGARAWKPKGAKKRQTSNVGAVARLPAL
jgi:hypothetical protein